jgi:hypothetical protein
VYAHNKKKHRIHYDQLHYNMHPPLYKVWSCEQCEHCIEWAEWLWLTLEQKRMARSDSVAVSVTGIIEAENYMLVLGKQLEWLLPLFICFLFSFFLLVKVMVLYHHWGLNYFHKLSHLVAPCALFLGPCNSQQVKENESQVIFHHTKRRDEQHGV